MEYHIGDLLLVKPGTHVPPGSRYSSGIILSVHNDPGISRWNGTAEIFLEILWADGHKSFDRISQVSPYYEFIKP